MPVGSVTSIRLATNSSNPSLELWDIQRFHDGSGFSCELRVHCDGFSARREFYFSESSFEAARDAIARMDEDLSGEARFEEDVDSSQHLAFTMLPRGHVRVSGELAIASENPTRLTFSFETDQTCLRPLMKALDGLAVETTRTASPAKFGMG